MDWDKLRVFHAVAEAGSLTRAGEILHLSQSAVSRQIRALEDSLATVLFHRHARGLILTESGELLFEAAKKIRSEIDRTEVRIHDDQNAVQGELRVTTTTGFGTLWLAPRIGQLFARHPNLKIDLRLAEHVLDLSMREADVAIRMKEPSQAELIRRRLMTVNMRLYASQEYLAVHGAPSTRAQLHDHRLISQSPAAEQANPAYHWTVPFLKSDHCSHMTVNNYFGVLQAWCCTALGSGSCPTMSRTISRSSSGYCRMSRARTFPFTLPIPKNSGIRNGWRHSAISSFMRSSHTEKSTSLMAVCHMLERPVPDTIDSCLSGRDRVNRATSAGPAARRDSLQGLHLPFGGSRRCRYRRHPSSTQ